MLRVTIVPSPSAACKGTKAALAQNSGATSGSPFSAILVNVGIVAPSTSSTSHPNPFSKINLSTSAIKFADAQFILATVKEHAEAVVVKELKPKASIAVKNTFLKYVIYLSSI